MTFIDFCAGIGGFRLGFEGAGFSCVGYVERDKFARQSYEAMYDTTGEWTAWGDLDMLLGLSEKLTDEITSQRAAACCMMYEEIKEI